MDRYSKLRDDIAIQPPEQALITILDEIKKFSVAKQSGRVYSLLPEALRASTWKAKEADVDRLINNVKVSAPEVEKQLEAVKIGGRNPIQDAKTASEGLRKAAEEINNVSSDIPAWLAQVFQLPPAIATGELSLPVGQQHFSIDKENLNTAFDLKTICGPRSEYDQVRITYKFFIDESEIDAGWHNDFQLRRYGWKDSVIAGVSFTKQSSTNTYKPTASISWVLDHAAWPKNRGDTSEKGVAGKYDIDWFSGIGLTSMAVDYDPSQDTELGLGLVSSFLNNRILVGYGWDLQSRQQSSFFFFSINLFETQGMIPSITSSK
jgi:hypothetical protein